MLHRVYLSVCICVGVGVSVDGVDKNIRASHYSHYASNVCVSVCFNKHCMFGEGTRRSPDSGCVSKS